MQFNSQFKKSGVGQTFNENKMAHLSENSFGPLKQVTNTYKAHPGGSNEARYLLKGQLKGPPFKYLPKSTHTVRHSVTLTDKLGDREGKINGLKGFIQDGLYKKGPRAKSTSSTLLHGQEDDTQLDKVTGGAYIATNINSEGNKSITRQTIYEEEEFYSDPGVDSASKKISRKTTRRKPKRNQDFRVGKSRKWNEFYSRGKKSKGNDEFGMAMGDACLENMKSDWQVYTRRSISKEKVSAKGKGVMNPSEQYFPDNWQGLEEKLMDPCQSTYSSSSENCESDKEAFEVEDVDYEKDREMREEESYEGLRLLLGK